MSEGPKGVFMVPGMEIFFRRLGQTFCERGVFRLSFIRVRGRARRRHDRIRFDGHLLALQLRVRPQWQQLAPGMVLVAEDVKQAIEEGCAVFDFLKGDYTYKYRFGARKRLVKRLLVSRR